MERMIFVPMSVIIIGLVAFVAVMIITWLINRRLLRKAAEDRLAGRTFPQAGCWSDMRRDGLWYNSDTDRVWRKTSTGWRKVA